MMLVSGVFRRATEEYSVFVLPDPVGPVTSTMPYGLQDRALELGQRLRLEAELGHVEQQVVLVEQTHDDLFAEQRRQGRNAEVELLLLAVLAVLDLDAAVLRQPLFADVELGHDLDAAGDRVVQLHRRGHDVVQNPVDAEPDAQFLLVRLDVNVARARFTASSGSGSPA